MEIPAAARQADGRFGVMPDDVKQALKDARTQLASAQDDLTVAQGHENAFTKVFDTRTSDLPGLSKLADGLADELDPRRAAEWLDRTRALRGEIERVDDALSQAEESVRLNPRRLRFPDPAAGLRDGVDTLERAATDLRVLARSVADSARLDSEDSPVKDPETRARLAAVIAELAGAVRAYGQLIEADPEPVNFPAAVDDGASGSEPLAAELSGHLEEAHRQQDRLADLLRTDPAERPDGWPLRGEILAHVDRLRNELQPRRPAEGPERPATRRSSRVPRVRHRSAVRRALGQARRGGPWSARRSPRAPRLTGGR